MKKGEVLEVEIEDFAAEGKGIAKVGKEGFVVFVPNTIPGQLVKTKIAKKRKNYAEGKLIDVLKPSPNEVITDFQPISGAPYLNLPIEQQKVFKKNNTIQLFKRIAGIEGPEQYFDEFIESPKTWHYRNKMEYSFSVIRHDLATNEEIDDFALGFKRRGTWWKVENLDKDSGLFDQEFESKLKEIRVYLQKTGLPAWHPPKKQGFFRHLVLRKSYAHDKLLINLVTTSKYVTDFDKNGFIELLQQLFGKRLAGVLLSVNDSVADREKLDQGNTELLYGTSTIVEGLHGLEFEISMNSFFQTNPSSAALLYQKAIDYLFEGNFDEERIVLDLFCGTGTIGQIVAKSKPNLDIVGVDIVEKAIEDAKENANRNKLNNVRFLAADVGKFLTEYPEYAGQTGAVILDPPRAGIAPKALRKLIAFQAPKIVYVSCNPATLARDIVQLKETGYNLQKFSLVDQFPHTAHVEAVTLFTKN